MIYDEITSILQLSRRTIGKIMLRMKLGCSICGWDIATCDVHHILPKQKGGTDAHENLTYLCPNHHREAHAIGLKKYISLVDHIGDRWKDFYKSPKQARFGPRSEKARRNMSIANAKTNNISGFVSERKQTVLNRAPAIVKALEESDIDFNSYGWVTKASNKKVDSRICATDQRKIYGP